MDFALTEEQKMIHEYGQSLVKQFDRAYWVDCAEHKRFPVEMYRQVAADGFVGVMVPEADTVAVMSPRSSRAVRNCSAGSGCAAKRASAASSLSCTVLPEGWLCQPS